MESPANTTVPNDNCVVNDHMVPFATLYILIFLVGTVGCMVALWAFVRVRIAKKCMNVYLLNLLTSDLLLMMALPVKVAKDLGVESVHLKIFHCQVSGVLIYINMYASIIFLAFISVHRYIQITQGSKLLQEVNIALVMSAVVWLLVLFINVPNMAFPIVKEVPSGPGLTCSALKQSVGKNWHTLSVCLGMAIFLNTSAAVLLSNGLVLKRLLRRSEENDTEQRASARHATHNIAAVTAAYVVCFVPYHVVRMPYTFTQNQVINDCGVKQHLFLAKESTLLLAILHPCFDPVLYFYFCSSFRDQITQAFSTRRPTAKPSSTSEPPAELELQLNAELEPGNAQ